MADQNKTYTDAQIQDEYNKLSDSKKVSVLYSALSIMGSYNGRSNFTCIAMAMGYRNTSGERNDWQKAE